MRKIASEVKKGTPQAKAPLIERYRFVAETRDIPIWSRSGLVFKDHYVDGIAGEPLLSGNVPLKRYPLDLGGRKVSLEHSPLGWVDLGGHKALFSVHPHDDNELTVVVHGLIDEVCPEKIVKTRYLASKEMPQYAGGSSAKERYEILRHRVVPVPKDEYEHIESSILSLLQGDLSTAYSKLEDDYYWKAVEEAHKEFSKVLDEYLGPSRAENEVQAKDRAGQTPSGFLEVQKILADQEAASELYQFSITRAIAEFQKELSWHLQLQEAAQKGTKVRKIKEAAGSRDVVDLRKWRAYLPMVVTRYRYLRTLLNAVKSGKLKVNFVHRVG